VTIEPEAVDHDRIELADHEVRQVEGSDLPFVDFCKALGTREKLVTVSSGEPLDAVLVEHGVQSSARSTICVGDEDLVVAVFDLLQFCSHGFGDFLGRVVEQGGQALDRDAIPTAESFESQQFPRQCAASEQQYRSALTSNFSHPRFYAACARWPTSFFAVSTAVAASRQ